jgi:hypothetical protein
MDGGKLFSASDKTVGPILAAHPHVLAMEVSVFFLNGNCISIYPSSNQRVSLILSGSFSTPSHHSHEPRPEPFMLTGVSQLTSAPLCFFGQALGPKLLQERHLLPA